MGALINNEVRKIIFKKKTLVVFLGFVALVGLICYGLYRNQVNGRRFNSPEYMKQNYNSQISELKNEETQPDITDARKTEIESQISDLQQQIQNIDNNVKEDWRTTEEKQKESDIANINNASVPQKEKSNMQVDLNEVQYRLDHNIAPIPEYELNAFSYINSLIEGLGTVFLIVGILVFAADSVSGEFTPPTMKVLLTQPVSRAKVLFSKYIASIVTSLLLIISVEALGFIIIGLIFGFGNPLNPVSIGSRYQFDTLNMGNKYDRLKLIAGSTYIIPMWKYALMSIGIEILYIITCVSFAFLVSSVLNSSMVSMVTGVMISIVLFVLQGLDFIGKIAPFTFIFHGNSGAILKGQLATGFGNPNFTIAGSIILLITSTIIFYVIAHFVFTKKDILI